MITTRLTFAQESKLALIAADDPGSQIVGFSIDGRLELEPTVRRSSGFHQRLTRTGRLVKAPEPVPESITVTSWDARLR